MQSRNSYIKFPHKNTETSLSFSSYTHSTWGHTKYFHYHSKKFLTAIQITWRTQENQGPMTSRKHSAKRVENDCLLCTTILNKVLDAVNINIFLTNSRVKNMIKSKWMIFSQNYLLSFMYIRNTYLTLLKNLLFDKRMCMYYLSYCCPFHPTASRRLRRLARPNRLLARTVVSIGRAPR